MEIQVSNLVCNNCMIKGVDEVLLIPLYPQFAMATTETILVLAEEIRKKQFPNMEFTIFQLSITNPIMFEICLIP